MGGTLTLTRLLVLLFFFLSVRIMFLFLRLFLLLCTLFNLTSGGLPHSETGWLKPNGGRTGVVTGAVCLVPFGRPIQPS